MDKYIEISLLYDFYGELLSQRQKNIIEYYYNDNFSLREIADEINISRQGVYDNLKRAEEQLYEFDEKLKLREKYLTTKMTITSAINSIQDCINITSQEQPLKTYLSNTQRNLEKLLKEI